MLLCGCRPQPEPAFPSYPVRLDVPPSILADHRNILLLLDEIAADTASLNLAAMEKLDTLLPHHFKEEELSVLPLLQLLRDSAAAGSLVTQADTGNLVLRLRDKVKHLNIEHQLIAAYIQELLDGSSPRRQNEILRLQAEIKRHAAVEEEIYFPAAVLILKYYSGN